MATIALTGQATREERVFAGLALAMATVIVAGFANNYLQGRSSFASPPIVHAHAAVFMGWVALFVTQSVLVARSSMRVHRTLGWVAGGWTVAMVLLGFVMAVRSAQEGLVPFFMKPQLFLIVNPLTVFTFAALTWIAIAVWRRTDWHRRLHICAMATIMGPGFGRLLPMPLLKPWSFEIAWACGLAFPLIGMAFDLRRRGAVHPAWMAGVAVIAGAMLGSQTLARSAAGGAIYRHMTAGTPGEHIAGLAYPPMPH